VMVMDAVLMMLAKPPVTDAKKQNPERTRGLVEPLSIEAEADRNTAEQIHKAAGR